MSHDGSFSGGPGYLKPASCKASSCQLLSKVQVHVLCFPRLTDLTSVSYVRERGASLLLLLLQCVRMNGCGLVDWLMGKQVASQAMSDLHCSSMQRYNSRRRRIVPAKSQVRQ